MDMPLDVVSTLSALSDKLRDWRGAGDHIALVPTMGNLHEGQISLMEVARQNAERVVASIFVNPTQFADDEAFESYPRTPELDQRRLRLAKVDLLFAPDVETMYPFGTENATTVNVPVLSEELCGIFSPGYFSGITSSVSRLFSLVRPDVAVFGQKNYQQYLVIRRMVEDLRLPIRIVMAPTCREEDGLAMSSRNQRLSELERQLAPELYAVLNEVAEALESGNRDFDALETGAIERLRKVGFEPEYASVRRAENLASPDRDNDELVVLAAAWLGDTRLIDNVLVRV